MNYYTITTLLIILTTLPIGIFVHLKNRRNIINNSWALLNLAVGEWAIGYYFVINNNISQAVALIAARISHIGALSIPIFYFHFILALLNLQKIKKVTLSIFYTITILLLTFTFSPLFIKNVVPKLNFNHYFSLGPLYYLYPLIYLILTLYAIDIMFRHYGSLTSLQRCQIRYIILASIMGLFGGATTFLLGFNFPIPPFGLILIAIYPIIITYAILRYRLMDIQVIIREATIFAGIYGFAVGVFALVMFFGQTVLAGLLSPYEWLLPVSALFVITFSVRPIERIMYGTVGRQLFRRRFEYQKVLRDASVGMARIKDPDKLLNLIVHIITKNMKVDNAGVLLLDENNKYYTLKAARGKRAELKGMQLKANEPLIDWLVEKKDALVYEELDRWLRDERLYPHRSVLRLNLDRIKEQMEQLGASVCIPSFYRDVLLGILILGDKSSGDMYSQDDLDLLATLSDEAAIAVRNALLFSELHKKADEISGLYEKEHRLFIHTSISFAAAIDARDDYTHGHSERVTAYTLAIADNLHGIPEIDQNPRFRETLHIAALLHDIGKIGIKDEILHKKDKLTEEETQTMKKHPVTGSIILSPIKELKDIIDGAKYHHERYDGGGYPEGLKGELIPLIARIIGVADTFDAMTTDRPYRKRLDDSVATQEIKNGAGTQFDPEVVAAFLKAQEKGMLFGAPLAQGEKTQMKAAS